MSNPVLVTRETIADGTVIRTYKYPSTRTIRCKYCGTARISHLTITDVSHCGRDGTNTEQHTSRTIIDPCDYLACPTKPIIAQYESTEV